MGYWGYRYYDAGSGRWISRDPIGEQGGKSLYHFTSNDPIMFVDVFGLFRWPWQGCCNGEKYNGLTECCCVANKRVRNGTGELLKDKNIDTGVSLCEASITWSPLPWDVFHKWIEFSDHSASIGFGPGGVSSPDSYSGRSDAKCKPVKLSPCDVNIENFRNNVRDLARDPTRPYDRTNWNCGHWRDQLILKAIFQSGGKCGTHELAG